MLRRLVECLAYPIRERLAVLLCSTFPGIVLGVAASDWVLRSEGVWPLWRAPRPFPLSAAGHVVNVSHLPEVYPNYFDYAIRFLLISHCESRINTTTRLR